METIILGITMILLIIFLSPKRGRGISQTTIRYDISAD